MVEKYHPQVHNQQVARASRMEDGAEWNILDTAIHNHLNTLNQIFHKKIRFQIPGYALDIQGKMQTIKPWNHSCLGPNGSTFKPTREAMAVPLLRLRFPRFHSGGA